MNREIIHPLSIGAIVTIVIMAFPINLNIIFIALGMSIFLSYAILLKSRKAIDFFIVFIAVFIGVLALYRINITKESDYLPFSEDSVVKGDIVASKDSSPVRGGFIAPGKLYMAYTSSFEGAARKTITIFSKEEFFRGEVFKGARVKITDKKFSSNIKIGGVRNFYNDFYRKRADIIKVVGSKTNSALFTALVTGNKNRIPIYQLDQFRESGCSHILALSGFHVGVIVLILFFILRLLFTGTKIYVILFLALGIYIFFVGLSPSLFRSVLMFGVGAYFKARGIRIKIYTILLIVFYIIILLDPNEFYTLSFRLSFLALFGIITLGVEIEKLLILKWMPKLIRVSISASISALILTSIVTIPVFKTLYPVGILAATVVTPLITLFMFLGITTLFFPQLSIILKWLENFIYITMEYFSRYPIIDEKSLFYPYVTFIIAIIPVILLLLKLYRRVDVRRFYIKFKL